MSYRKTSFAEGEYYHLYNRGNSKQKIFHSHVDYERFMLLLYFANSDESIKIDRMSRQGLDIKCKKRAFVAIGAWTIMPNHFHILATPLVENGISKFMQKLTTAYSMYYNQKYERTGSLFEGKFKSEHVPEDRYLKYLFSYIHLNCLKLYDANWRDKMNDYKEMKNYLDRYMYSSYTDYINPQRFLCSILAPSAFPDYFKETGSMEKEIYSWITYNENL